MDPLSTFRVSSRAGFLQLCARIPTDRIS